MAITLSERLSDRLEKAASEHGTSVEAMLEEMLGPPFVVAEVAAVREALEQVKEGRYRPFEEFFAEHRARYPDPSKGNQEAAPLWPEDITAIGEGIADAEAGRVRDGAVVLAEMRQRSGLA